ncbi:MAG: hypothetical protein AAGH65_05975 [Pseudomonadota bacterium]
MHAFGDAQCRAQWESASNVAGIRDWLIIDLATPTTERASAAIGSMDCPQQQRKFKGRLLGLECTLSWVHCIVSKPVIHRDRKHRIDA